jgi:hypothetical protein
MNPGPFGASCAGGVPVSGERTVSGPKGIPGAGLRRCPARGDTSGAGSRLRGPAGRGRQG